MPKDKNDEIKNEEKTEVKQPTHRLFCQACTGIAMFYTEGDELPKSVICRACGKPQVVNKDNLIKL